MLILSRKRNEATKLSTPEGREILVTVVSIHGDRVRLGFVADNEVSIFRTELLTPENSRSTAAERLNSTDVGGIKTGAKPWTAE